MASCRVRQQVDVRLGLPVLKSMPADRRTSHRPSDRWRMFPSLWPLCVDFMASFFTLNRSFLQQQHYHKRVAKAIHQSQQSSGSSSGQH